MKPCGIRETRATWVVVHCSRVSFLNTDYQKYIKNRGDGWLRTEDRGQKAEHIAVGLVKFTQPTRFGWFRTATPTLRNCLNTKICEKQGGWVVFVILFLNCNNKIHNICACCSRHKQTITFPQEGTCICGF